MAHIFHPDSLSFTERQSPVPEFCWHTSPKLAALAGAKRLQFDLRSLDPGKYSYPYHFHRNAEEIFVILSGCAMLRTQEGFEEVGERDILFFEIGPRGAHQLYNHTQKPCLYLDIRTDEGIDVCDYPDSGKVNILPERELYESAGKVDYYKNEEQVAGKWPASIVGNTQKEK